MYFIKYAVTVKTIDAMSPLINSQIPKTKVLSGVSTNMEALHSTPSLAKFKIVPAWSMNIDEFSIKAKIRLNWGWSNDLKLSNTFYSFQAKIFLDKIHNCEFSNQLSFTVFHCEFQSLIHFRMWHDATAMTTNWNSSFYWQLSFRSNYSVSRLVIVNLFFFQP